MAWVLQIGIACLIFFLRYVIHKTIKFFDARKKLEVWMPSAPRLPILGSLLEFGGHAAIINDVTRLTNNSSKQTYIELVNRRGIISRNYDFLEFVLSSNTLLTKASIYKFVKPWLGTGLLTGAGYKWKTHRKVVTPAFHFSILEQFIDSFNSNGDVLVEKLKQETLNRESVEICAYITSCTLDIICETAMGVNIESQNNKNSEYVNAVKSMCRIIITRDFSLWKRFDLLYRFSKEYKQQCKNLQILHNFTDSVILKKKEDLKIDNNKVHIKDTFDRKQKMAFLDVLLNCTVDGKPLTTEEIREEVDTFMFAGHDTTSTTIAAAIFVLSNEPDIQKSVRDELNSIFGNDRKRPITYQDLQDMRYLELVIKEVLRLYPAVPMIGRYAEEDLEYRGQIIPKNTEIIAFIHGINRDPDYYEDPEKFNPERFLDTSGKNPFAYIPFSAGPRNCIGQKFAMLQLKTILAKIIMNFEVLPTNPPHEPIISFEIVAKSVNGICIKLKEC